MELALGRLHVTVAIAEGRVDRRLDTEDVARLEDVELAYNRERRWRRIEADRERRTIARLLRGDWRP